MPPRRTLVYAGLAMVGHWLRYRAMLGQPGDSISCLDHFCTAGRVVGLDYRRLVRSTREAVQAGVDERDCVCATMTYAIEELEDMMLRAAGHA